MLQRFARGRQAIHHLLLLSLIIGSIVGALFLMPAHASAAPSTSAVSRTTMAPLYRTNSGNDAIIFVHGVAGIISGSGANYYNCSDYWHDALDYMRNMHDGLQWQHQDFRLIGYYNGDINCTNGDQSSSHSANLHNSEYKNHCANYYPEGTNASQDGTTNESIYHLSCLLAWYLYDNFAVNPGWNVEIVAHSMGGLIVRNALYQVQQKKATWTFPSTLGNISDIVTFGTPNNGIAANPCNCKQGDDMYTGSSFMNEMRNNASNPQAIGDRSLGTDWTLIGSQNDSAANIWSTYDAVDIPYAGHKIIYNSWIDPASGFYVSYGHTDYFHYVDGNGHHINDDSWIYSQSWCDWQTQGASACNDLANFPSGNGVGAMHDMFLALWYDTW